MTLEQVIYFLAIILTTTAVYLTFIRSKTLYSK
jgi:hypothetical protein